MMKDKSNSHKSWRQHKIEITLFLIVILIALSGTLLERAKDKIEEINEKALFSDVPEPPNTVDFSISPVEKIKDIILKKKVGTFTSEPPRAEQPSYVLPQIEEKAKGIIKALLDSHTYHSYYDVIRHLFFLGEYEAEKQFFFENRKLHGRSSRYNIQPNIYLNVVCELYIPVIKDYFCARNYDEARWWFFSQYNERIKLARRLEHFYIEHGLSPSNIAYLLEPLFRSMSFLTFYEPEARIIFEFIINSTNYPDTSTDFKKLFPKPSDEIVNVFKGDSPFRNLAGYLLALEALYKGKYGAAMVLLERSKENCQELSMCNLVVHLKGRVLFTELYTQLDGGATPSKDKVQTFFAITLSDTTSGLHDELKDYQKIIRQWIRR